MELIYKLYLKCKQYIWKGRTIIANFSYIYLFAKLPPERD